MMQQHSTEHLTVDSRRHSAGVAKIFDVYT